MQLNNIRDKQVQLRLTIHELETLQKKAEEAALNMSDFLRLSLFSDTAFLPAIEPGRAVLIEGMVELTDVAHILRLIVRQRKIGASQIDTEILTQTLERLGNLSIKLINFLDHGCHG